ncbi:MAG: hypothetical protein Q8M65_01415, partial [Rhodoglobus sp.]|nr:hypothetical protein [Rhodoglobus sp.]
DRSTLCALNWYDPEGERQLVSYEDGVTPATMLTDFAPELQGCFVRDVEAEIRYVNADCTTLHNGQYLMYFDLQAALGADFVGTMDPETTLFADYEPLDDYCATIIDTVYPGVLDSESWIPWSDQTGRHQGWVDFDGTVDPDKVYPAYCGIFAPTLTIKGDVISGDATASLILG